MADPQHRAELRRRLEEASRDLVYSSEGDFPFVFVEVPIEGREWPPTARRFAELMDASHGTPAEDWDLDEFFARHVERVDVHDTRAQGLRPRYDRLRMELRTRLEDVRVFRVGRVQVRCWVAGVDPATGTVVGLETMAIET